MRIKKLNQRWLDNSRFPALEAVCLLFLAVLIGPLWSFGFRTTTLNRNALYKVVRDCICFDSLFFVAGREKLRRRLKQSDEKTSNKNDLIICVFLSFSQFTCFPPPFILSSDWLPMEITLDLVSQHSIEIGWMAALRWRIHTSNEKIDVVDWLVLGLQIIYIFSVDASLLQIFEAVYYRRNFTKRVSICGVWRHTTFASSLDVQGYEVGQVTGASKQVFLYRLGEEPGERIRPTQGSIVCKSISCIE